MAPPPPSSFPSSSSSSSSSPNNTPFSPFPPSSVLIIGSGVFGLSTAWALTRRDEFSQCSITVVDRSDSSSSSSSPSVGAAAAAGDEPVFPARDSSSIDSSRIVRADYADPAYAALAAEAQLHWRKRDCPDDLGAQGRYNECGLVLVADPPPPSAGSEKKKTGIDYVRASWENVSSMMAASSSPDGPPRVRELLDAAAIRAAVGTGGGSGSWGYVNEGSGWADAEASMAWLYGRVRRTGRVTFVAGTVASLEHDDASAVVTGARLTDGRVLSADLVVLAAGAWTGSLVDMAGQATPTGQVLGYLDITEAEQQRLAGMPVLLNMTTGLFVIPPANGVLKVARHAYGYINPTTLPAGPLPSSPSSAATTSSTSSSTSTSSASAVVVVSHPLTHLTDPTLEIPAEGAADLRRALREMVPLPALRDRPFARTRLCWYTDTATGDFLFDYHPRWRRLFLATGGSGHGFKFLPVVGDKIVDCIAGRCPPEFRDKWAWKPEASTTSTTSTSTPWASVVTEDGSRGGRPGLILAEEMGRARS